MADDSFTACATLRIVSLPRELKDEYEICDFVADLIGGVRNRVTIEHMTSPAGVYYRTAIVEIGLWPDDEFCKAQKQRLVDAGDKGVIFTDFPNWLTGKQVPLNFHFNNGKPMSHIKIIAIKPVKPVEPVEPVILSTDPLMLPQDAWTSIYIPVLPADLEMDNGDMRYNKNDTLCEFFEDQLKIGRVSRIDFMDKSIPGQHYVGRCAYVHFDTWYDNEVANLVRQNIDEKGEFWCNGYYDGYEFCRFDRNRFITLKVNHKPIPVAPADMNVHQIAAANAALEARVKELEEQNAQLKADYTDVCIHRSNQIMSMMVREEKIAKLEAEVKSSTMVSVPDHVAGKGFQLDIGPMLAKNVRLNEVEAQLEKRDFEIASLKDLVKKVHEEGYAVICAKDEEIAKLKKPLTMEDMFNQLRSKMDHFKEVSAELLVKYGTNDAVNEAGVFDTPEYSEYSFDFIEAIKDLYEEFVPIIWR
jgi:hypothetical protein